MDGSCPQAVGSDLQALGFLTDGRHPDSRESVALRGTTWERGSWSIAEDGGNIQPSVRTIDDATGMPEKLHLRRGTLTTVVLRQQSTGGGSFAQGDSARAVQRHCRTHHRRKRWSD
jgi:hypothetical protein